MPLKVSHGIGTWIKDFQKSDAPQFKGKSDKERRDQAIAAYLSAKRDQKEAKEPPPFDGPYKKKKSVVPGKHGEGPSTAKHLAKMGMKQAEKKPVKESTEQLDELSPGLLGRYTRARGSLNITKKQSKMKARAHQKMRDKTKDLSAIAGKYSNPADLTKTEATTFEVDIEGLPKMYIKDKSPGAVKAKLRGIVKQPSMIQGVDRVTDAKMKKTYRDKAQGRDEVEENVNEISGELAQRYHDKAVKAPAPKDKKDPLKHTIKRFASMQKAQDIIHKSELKRIGGQK